jgi:hypothetical protein
MIDGAVPKECGREPKLSELGGNACRKEEEVRQEMGFRSFDEMTGG